MNSALPLIAKSLRLQTCSLILITTLMVFFSLSELKSEAIISSFLLSGIAGLSFVQNDLTDLKADATNKVGKFENASNWELKIANSFFVFGSLLVFTLVIIIPSLPVIPLLGIQGCLFAYNKLFNKFLFIGNTVAAFCSVSVIGVPLIMNFGDSHSPIYIYISCLMISAFLYHVSREIHYDIIDRRGDSSEDRISFGVILTSRASLTLRTILAIASFVSVAILTFLYHPSDIILVRLMPSICFSLITYDELRAIVSLSIQGEYDSESEFEQNYKRRHVLVMLSIFICIASAVFL